MVTGLGWRHPRRLFTMLVVVAVAAACGSETAESTHSSPTPQVFGTATLSETGCAFAMPDNLPLREVKFTLVNKTAYAGRFILGYIHDGHTFKDLIDYWNGPSGQGGEPDFTSEIRFVDVRTSGSGEMVATIVVAGTYAFHCGYFDPAIGKVRGFWHELKAG